MLADANQNHCPNQGEARTTCNSASTPFTSNYQPYDSSSKCTGVWPPRALRTAFLTSSESEPPAHTATASEAGLLANSSTTSCPASGRPSHIRMPKGSSSCCLSLVAYMSMCKSWSHRSFARMSSSQSRTHSKHACDGITQTSVSRGPARDGLRLLANSCK